MKIYVNNHIEVVLKRTQCLALMKTYILCKKEKFMRDPIENDSTNIRVYDYVDSHIPMFDNMYAKRLKAYRQRKLNKQKFMRMSARMSARMIMMEKRLEVKD